LRDTIEKLESILVTDFRPTFLSVNYNSTDKNPVIHIVMSSKLFLNKTVDQRIASVFKCLLTKDKSIIENNALIVETFDSKEMSEIFEYVRG